MPSPHARRAVAHGAEHLVAEYLAALVLIGAGLVILGLLLRRRRLGRSSQVALVTPGDAVAAVRATLFTIGFGLAMAGAALALGANQAPAAASLGRVGSAGHVGSAGSFGEGLGVGFGTLALVALATARFGVGRMGQARLLRARTALSIAIVPIVGVAFLAVVVTLAAPSSVAIIADH